MKKEFSKQSKERQMFIDFWTICQNYWIAEKSDSYWENLIKDTDEFSKKYKSIFASKIAVSFIEAKEKELKGE